MKPHINGPASGAVPPASLGPTFDLRWRTLTEEANALYRGGDTASARKHYEAALSEAERLLDAVAAEHDARPAPIIYNVSCHNLAELARALGENAEAEAYCRRAYERLLAVARNPASPLELRISCVRNLRNALAELTVRLNERHAPPGELDRIVEPVRNAAFSVFRIARHAELARDNCPHCPLS